MSEQEIEIIEDANPEEVEDVPVDIVGEVEEEVDENHRKCKIINYLAIEEQKEPEAIAPSPPEITIIEASKNQKKTTKPTRKGGSRGQS